jgi:hypothetical protein
MAGYDQYGEDILDAVEEYRDTHPEDLGRELHPWMVTYYGDYGEVNMVIYASPEAAYAVENDDSLAVVTVRKLDPEADMGMVFLTPTPEITPPPVTEYEGQHRGTGRQRPHRGEPQHGRADVTSINRARLSTPEPRLEAASKERITRMPRHRRAAPRQPKPKKPPESSGPFPPGYRPIG